MPPRIAPGRREVPYMWGASLLPGTGPASRSGEAAVASRPGEEEAEACLREEGRWRRGGKKPAAKTSGGGRSAACSSKVHSTTSCKGNRRRRAAARWTEEEAEELRSEEGSSRRGRKHRAAKRSGGGRSVAASSKLHWTTSCKGKRRRRAATSWSEEGAIDTGLLAGREMDPFWSAMQDGSEAFGMSSEQPNVVYGGQGDFFPESEQHPGFTNIPFNDGVGGMYNNPVHVGDTPLDSNTVNAGASNVRRGRVKKLASRGVKQANFGPEEDLKLVAVWLEVSTDAVTGTDQPKETYWGRITRIYNEHLGPYPTRTLKSLDGRWRFIQESCTKFQGYYQQVLYNPQSGTTDTDKVALALTLYQQIEKRSFPCMHCWEELKDQAKWIDLQETPGGGNDPCDMDNATPGGSNDVPINVDTPSSAGAASKRPLGRDSCKAARKRTASSGSSSEFVSSMKEMHIDRLAIMQRSVDCKDQRMSRLLEIEEKKAQQMAEHSGKMLALEQDRMQVERERQDWQNVREEERILSIDLSNCSSAQVEYYKSMQEEILERRRRRMRQRNDD